MDNRKTQARLTTLERDYAVLKQEVHTVHANYLTALERNERKMAELKTDMAKRDAEAARRDRDNTRWIVASILGGVGIAVVILGFLIRSGGTVPGP